MRDAFETLATTIETASDWSDETFMTRAQALTGVEFDRLDDIPVVTSDTFRYRDVVRPGAPDPVVTFRTSGTTRRFRGEHALHRTDVYRASALRCFRSLVLERRPLERMISLVPPLDVRSDSSLAWMLDLFARELFPGRTSQVVGDDGLDPAAFEAALAGASVSCEPTLLFATTLAASALVDTGLEGALPAGSLILTTGGPKRQSGSVDSDTVDDILNTRFGAAVGSEYGMTELLSQAYRIGDEPFRFPGWCRVIALDPRTGRRAAHGKPGLLRVIDLANADSAIAVQTADLAIVRGDREFTYAGRATGAETRGCSITYDELVS